MENGIINLNHYYNYWIWLVSLTYNSNGYIVQMLEKSTGTNKSDKTRGDYNKVSSEVGVARHLMVITAE